MSIEELKREYERQLANPPRCFDRPQDVAQYISEHTPTKTVMASLELTVYSVIEKELCWHINLIAKSNGDDFEERKRLYESLHEDTQAQFTFCLSLWKAKKHARNRVTGSDFIAGNTYTFGNVKDLHMYFGVAQGSLQASSAFVEQLADEQADEPTDESTDEPRAKQKRKTGK